VYRHDLRLGEKKISLKVINIIGMNKVKNTIYNLHNVFEQKKVNTKGLLFFLNFGSKK